MRMRFGPTVIYSVLKWELQMLYQPTLVVVVKGRCWLSYLKASNLKKRLINNDADSTIHVMTAAEQK